MTRLLIAPEPEETLNLVLMALAEDVGHGDVTSAATIPADRQAQFAIAAREPMVVCGLGIAQQAFEAMDPMCDFVPTCADGDQVAAGVVLATIRGQARALLSAERVALNLMQRMCGVATLTARYVAAVAGTQARILDTRKTMPMLRLLDKYAVRAGGGVNHRMRLDDAVLIKDNHLAVAGSIAQAVAQARAYAPSTMTIEVECDTLAQVQEALEAGVTRLLLDNMSLEQLAQAVALARGKAITEASGGVSLETVAAIAATGVDYISVGKLTHSAPNVDIGLDAL